MDIFDFLLNLLITVIGIVVVLWLESLKRPKLSFDVGVASTIDEDDVLKRHPTTFLRVRVSNRTVPWWLSWVYTGEPAMACTGKISFFDLEGNRLIKDTMEVRWSNTPEPEPRRIRLDDGTQVYQLVGFQKTIDVPTGSSTLLDVVNKLKDEDECYGWNNESYLHDWKHPKWKFEAKKLLAQVIVMTGGREFSDVFIIHNEGPLGHFRLEKAMKSVKQQISEE